MKRSILIIALLLCQLAAIGQNGDTKYKLTLMSDPEGSCSFTPTPAKEYSAGEVVSFVASAYTGNGFSLQYLMSADTILSTTGSVEFTMPAHDVTITAVCSYAPTLPGDPGESQWNEQTGAMSVTMLTPGRLIDLVGTILKTQSGKTDYSLVRSLTVAGKANNNDLNSWYISQFTNLNYLDFCRTVGVSQVGGNLFRNHSSLKTVLMPSTIEQIGALAFDGCAALESFTCFATTPPELKVSNGKYPFNGTSPALVVYVSAESLPLYAEADGWKDMELMPITQGVHAMTVNMPANADMQQYKDIFLELVNTKTTQTRRYVLTTQTHYTFTNLIAGTQYNVYLRNARGDIIGSILAVDIEDKDVQVTFPALKALRDITLQLRTPDGSPVGSDDFTITWTDVVGNYLATGSTLPGQMDGAKAIAKVKLGELLGTQYAQPADTLVSVGQSSALSITLTPLQQRPFSGIVTGAATGSPIRGANIAVTQLLNGIYPNTFTTTTDAQGHWSLTAFDAPAEISAQADGYVPQTHSCSVRDGENLAFALDDLDGTTIHLNLYYTPAVRVGEEAVSEDIYSEFANISYSVYDETHQQELSNFVVQYPRLVLQNYELDQGTRLRITATSPGDLFMPVTTTCTVKENGDANATLHITQLGCLRASFSQTDNSAVVGMLYDENGQLKSTNYYGKAKLSIDDIPDGRYTLVTMGESRMFNGVNTLEALKEMRLQEGRDYVKNELTIQSGRIDSLHNQRIPMLDETVFYYTGGETSFSANKTETVVGNYVTLRAQVDFKAGFAPSNVKLLFDLPNGCSLVEGTVMEGSELVMYEVEGNRVIVPLSHIGDLVRFCVVPTNDGTLTPTASVNFSNGDDTVTQPIGSVSLIVQSLSITAPATVADENVAVGGTALANSTVKVYDDGVLIGQTETAPDGYWVANCKLFHAFNLSQHNVYAVITTTEGITMQTTVETVTVSHGTLAPVVTMAYWDNLANKPSDVVFDFYKQTVSQLFWTVSFGAQGFGEVPMTFDINFTDGENIVNDTLTISNVLLTVYLEDDKTTMDFHVPYNKRKGCWSLQHDFTSLNGGLPRNVEVACSMGNEVMADRYQMDFMKSEMLAYIAESQQAVKDCYHSFDDLLGGIEEDETIKELKYLLSLEERDEWTQERIDSIIATITGDNVGLDEHTQQVLNQVDELLDKEDVDYETLMQVEALMAPLVEESLKEDEQQKAEIEALLQTAEEDVAGFDSLIVEAREAVIDILSLFYLTDTTTFQPTNGDIDFTVHDRDKDKQISVKQLTSIDVEQLLADGYMECPMTDGSKLYFLYEPNAYHCVDTKSGTLYTVTVNEKDGNTRKVASRTGPNWQDWLLAILKMDCFSNLIKASKEILAVYQKNERYQGDWDLVSSGLTFISSEFNNLRGFVECIYDNAIKEFHKRVINDFDNERIPLQKMEENAKNTVKNLTKKCQEKGKELTQKKAELKRIKKEINFYEVLKKTTTDVDLISEWDKDLVKLYNKAASFETSIKSTENLIAHFGETINELKAIQKNCAEGISKLYKEEFKITGVLDHIPPTMKEAISGSKKTFQIICEGAKWVGTAFSVVLQLVPLTMDVIASIQDIGAWLFTAEPILRMFPCEDDSGKLWKIWWDFVAEGYKYTAWDVGWVLLDIAGLAIDHTPEVPLYGQWWASLACDITSGVVGVLLPERSAEAREKLINRLYDLNCYEYDDDNGKDDKGNGHRRRWKKMPRPAPPRPGKDPSGFVYEAVESNRLEGVKATCFYKEEVEDMYGDLHENTVLWNAEDFAQKNPLFTDTYGKYRWDVPDGLWQVKFEKEGYETTYSEWLPVPPPQLEVNIGMTQLRQPAVQRVKACTDGIDITFDKYMDPATLTIENIFVSKGGQTVGGRIELLNADSGYEKPEQQYASKVRFVPATPLTLTDKVQLTVRRAVESYAGLQMEQDFTQQFDVEQRIEAIIADSLVNIGEGGEYTMTVKVIPAEAAKDKRLTAVSLAEDVVTVVPVEGGQERTFQLKATGLGSAGVRFSLADEDLQATTLVVVRDSSAMTVAAPKASRMSGTEIYRGAEIRLTSNTAGATILYTLDGSCPCDAWNTSVMVYTGPIVATGDNLVIRAMAIANGMMESDVVEFNYKVITNIVGVEPAITKSTGNVVPMAYYTIDGRRIDRPTRGLNIVRYADGTARVMVVK